MSTTFSNNLFPKDPVLQVTILSPEKTIYTGTAIALSSVNEIGPFDVLPFHANLITIIKDYILVHEKGNKEQKIACEKGIMKVFENTVSVFLGVETFG